MSETSLKVAVKRYLRSIGAMTIKVSDRFTSGIPDLIVIHNGRTLFIELKTPTGVVSNLQKYTIEQINEHKGEAYVCRSVEEVKRIMEGGESA
jgi:Holliday junction resolvase-like predicted endonuclease